MRALHGPGQSVAVLRVGCIVAGVFYGSSSGGPGCRKGRHRDGPGRRGVGLRSLRGWVGSSRGWAAVGCGFGCRKFLALNIASIKETDLCMF